MNEIKCPHHVNEPIKIIFLHQVMNVKLIFAWMDYRLIFSDRNKLKRTSLLVLFCLALGSCSLIKKSEVEKAEIALQRETNEINAELNKRQKTHYKIQARETKKMMKRSYKRSKKLNKPRRLL